MLQEVSKQYNDAGLSVIPTDSNKTPIGEWTSSQKQIVKKNFSKAHGISLICGRVSGDIEAVDVDLKYDISGTLMQRYKSLINEKYPGLLSKLVVQSTPSQGYHFIYKCSKIQGNKKLANRPTTEEERKANPQDKVKVLIETRGEGGYICIEPTPGYKVIQGSLFSIPYITEEERDVLIECACELNEYFKEVYEPKVVLETGESPFDDYNSRGDVIALLQRHGWTVTGEKGSKVKLKRPGDTKARDSGNFDRNLNWFSVFSTSTEFDTQKAYKPSSVYAILEANGDFKLAAQKLISEGYGKRSNGLKNSKKRQHSNIAVSDAVQEGNFTSLIATRGEIEPKLKQIADGTFPQGLTTGIPTFNRYWLFKRGVFLVINGHDNVGKSVVLWYFCMLAAMYNGWRSIIYSNENSNYGVVRKLMEFYWGVNIKSINNLMWNQAYKFIEEHFTIIKNDDLLSYEQVLAVADCCQEQRKHDILLIDPYNGLVVDSSGQNTHEYHYSAITNLKHWGKKNDCCVYVNMHAISYAARQKENGQPAPPHKADTEQGTKVSAKADDFWTIHRWVYDPDKKYITEIHVRKIKEMETGGETTDIDAPFKLKAQYGLTAFVDETGFDPIKAWRDSRNIQYSIENQPEVKPSALKPNTSFTTHQESNPFVNDPLDPDTWQ